LAENQDVRVLQRRARRRLVGAVALAVFIIIALPIVFDREPKPITQDLVIEIPSQDPARMKPLAPPPAPPRPAEVVVAPQPEQKAEPEEKAAPTSTATEPKAMPAPAAAEPRRSQAAPNSESYIVQIGAFASAEKANEAQAKAKTAGVKAYAENVKGAKGEPLRRVRAGPFASREAAESAREKLVSVKLPGSVLAVREQQ
jgi:DedD protein